MAKLYFKFGAMGSSKTANALMTKFNYEEKGSTVWLIKPETDTRDNYNDENGNLITAIKSRIGLSSVATIIPQNKDIKCLFVDANKHSLIDAIICDECQFLTENQVDQLKFIAEYEDIPVLCFGLRSDFQTKMFPGSKRLFEIADSISEIKSICKCGKKAIVNARFDSNGTVITDGEQVDIGGNEKYESLCWKCWQELINGDI
jgi:thymidine kinase